MFKMVLWHIARLLGVKSVIWHPELSIILSPIGEGCVIHAPVWIGKNVIIGKRVKIEAMCFIPELVTLEDDVFLGPGVIMTNDFLPPSGGKHWRETLIKKGASIGANCTIVCGVTIGEKAMIGAGSVVTKDVGAGELWYGNPARKRGIRNG